MVRKPSMNGTLNLDDIKDDAALKIVLHGKTYKGHSPTIGQIGKLENAEEQDVEMMLNFILDVFPDLTMELVESLSVLQAQQLVKHIVNGVQKNPTAAGVAR